MRKLFEVGDSFMIKHCDGKVIKETVTEVKKEDYQYWYSCYSLAIYTNSNLKDAVKIGTTSPCKTCSLPCSHGYCDQGENYFVPTDEHFDHLKS